MTEQEVSAVEDPDLLEVALGGPDTTQRLKLLRRVERTTVAVGQLQRRLAERPIANWAKEGWILRSGDHAAEADGAAEGRLHQTPAATATPAIRMATGGYLGADNQLIRVRIDRTAPAPIVLWGYDDASFIYRVDQVTGGDTLTLAADPPDAFHFPTTGQLVEVLTTAAVLAEEPDESDPDQPGPDPARRRRGRRRPAPARAALRPACPADPTNVHRAHQRAAGACRQQPAAALPAGLAGAADDRPPAAARSR